MAIDQINPTRRALAIAFAIVSSWNAWGGDDRLEIVGDDALNMLALAADQLDFGHIEGVIASPLKYYARATIHDENPEDLTYCQMIESLDISIKILTGGAL